MMNRNYPAASACHAPSTPSCSAPGTPSCSAPGTPSCSAPGTPSCSAPGTLCSQPLSGRSCRQLLDVIDQTSFALDEILLFLDTHPCDQAALSYYHRVMDTRRNALNAYQASCGPLMADQVTSDNYWSWVSSKWPWEGGSCSCGNMRNVCNTR